MNGNLLIYGAYGYTGALVVQRAVAVGLQPILAGRDLTRLSNQAASTGLDFRAFSLDDPAQLEECLEGSAVVLHAAGPYVHTSRPMVAACLRRGVHYLDLTGEVPVYADIAARDAEAQAAGVMLMPGAGFDITPTDCLAAHLKDRLPSAMRLSLAWRAAGPAGFSRGTMKSVIEFLPNGCFIRENGRLVSVPFASRRRQVDFGRGPATATLLPWADVFTAYYSTGIPNIVDYGLFPQAMVNLMRMANWFRPILRAQSVRNFLARMVDRMPAGPTPEARQATRAIIYGEVEDERGRTAAARLSGPEAGYTWTPQIAVALAQRVLAGEFKAGFQTPSLVYGSGFIQQAGGSPWEDLP